MENDLGLNSPHSMGTTIIGVTYKDGVILGADSRTSTGKLLNFHENFFQFLVDLNLQFALIDLGFI